MCYNSFAYDDALTTIPVSKYDFIPEIDFAGKNISGPNFKWENGGIPTEWGNMLTFDECPICQSLRSEPIKLKNPGDNRKYQLSKYLENNRKTVTYLLVWKEGDINMEFTVKRGNKKAEDNDGYIQAKLSTNTEEFELIGETDFKVNIGDTIKLTLKVKKITADLDHKFDLKTQPAIEFYSSDNSSDWFDLEGNITESILVGKFAIIPYQCINADWADSGKFIKDEDFVVYSEDCLIAATEQINKAGYKTAYGGYSEDHDYAYLIYKDSEGHIKNTIKGDKKLHDKDKKPKKPIIYKDSYIEAIKYLKQAMADSIPVIAGTDHSAGTASYAKGIGDSTSDHSIVLVAIGKDSNRATNNPSTCYFYFFDNAVNNGSDDINKVYSNCFDYTLTANGVNIFIINRSTYKKYYVTQIRKSVTK